jgi:hypothetical protein
MSIYNKATLVQIPSGYKASGAKLYSVLPADGDGDFTVSADADATRVNADGLIESTVANQARLDYDFDNPQDPHLLLEPTRTQVAHYTNAISSANGYGLINGTLTTNSHTAPDGTNEASTFAATSSLGQFQKVKIGSSGVQYTVSVYVKRKTGTGTVYLRAIENTNTAVTVTNEWTRVSLTVTSTSTNLRYGMALATSGDEIYVWGFQVEAGSYATSLTPNSAGADITRTADSCTKVSFADMPTDYPFTAFWQGKIDNYDSSGFTSQVPFSLAATGTFNCYFALNFYSTTQLTLRRRNDTDTNLFITFSSDKDTTYKIAVCFISATAAKIYINGTEVLDSTSLTSVPYIGTNTPDSVFIGQLRDSSDTGKRNSCDQFMLFNEELSDSELIQITS